jgi:hypothetical protein
MRYARNNSLEVAMNSRITLPTYEVEFIPLERRLREDRRKQAGGSYSGPERRHHRVRRDDQRAMERTRLPL